MRVRLNFDQWLSQASHNLLHLEQINKDVANSWDWQVTTCFYVAVPLMDAHLATYEVFSKSHYERERHLDPGNGRSAPEYSLSEKVFLDYTGLYHYYKRSRYMCAQEYPAGPKMKDIDLEQNVILLDALITFFKLKHPDYAEELYKPKLNCKSSMRLPLQHLILS